jgi:hypothetical protein
MGWGIGNRGRTCAATPSELAGEGLRTDQEACCWGPGSRLQVPSRPELGSSGPGAEGARTGSGRPRAPELGPRSPPGRSKPCPCRSEAGPERTSGGRPVGACNNLPGQSGRVAPASDCARFGRARGRTLGADPQGLGVAPRSSWRPPLGRESPPRERVGPGSADSEGEGRAKPGDARAALHRASIARNSAGGWRVQPMSKRGSGRGGALPGTFSGLGHEL